jgi:predicted mannosyl-3-phosphoglycerate phosphatase (HAD superfamily)
MKEMENDWAVLCKRTDDPKLAWIEARLNAVGIETARRGSSWHADHILWVRQRDEAIANTVLTEPSPVNLRKIYPTIDDIPDDHPLFSGTVNPSGQAGIGWAL